MLVVHVDRDGHATGAHDGLGRGDEGVGGQRDPVALLDARRAQRELQRVGAVGDADAVRAARVRGELRLEGRAVRTTDERGGRQHPGEALRDLVGDLVALDPEIDQWDRHEATPCPLFGARRRTTARSLSLTGAGSRRAVSIATVRAPSRAVVVRLPGAAATRR